jgi:hypothetical protein
VLHKIFVEGGSSPFGGLIVCLSYTHDILRVASNISFRLARTVCLMMNVFYDGLCENCFKDGLSSEYW